MRACTVLEDWVEDRLPPRMQGRGAARPVVVVLVLLLVAVLFSVFHHLTASKHHGYKYWRGHKTRKVKFDYEHYWQLLHGDYLQKPFNVHDLAQLKWEQAEMITEDFKKWRQRGTLSRRRGSTYRGKVLNLAIARTGSESLTAALRLNDMPAHHTHALHLVDMMSFGATRVLVSLRDPVARFVSGFQRRFGKALHTMKPPNGTRNSDISRGTQPRRQLQPNQQGPAKAKAIKMVNQHIKVFRTLNDFVDALREVNNPRHALALNISYAYKSNSYMIPLVEYYLRPWGKDLLTEMWQLDQLIEWWKLKGVKVAFVCTQTLSADFNRVARAWGLDRLMEERINSSPRDSNSQELQRQVITEDNENWIRHVYRQDVALYHRHCERGQPPY